MDPVAAQLVIFAVEQLIKHAPEMAVELQALFAKGTPTKEEFAALREKVEAQDYFQFVPKSKLTH